MSINTVALDTLEAQLDDLTKERIQNSVDSIVDAKEKGGKTQNVNKGSAARTATAATTKATAKK